MKRIVTLALSGLLFLPLVSQDPPEPANSDNPVTVQTPESPKAAVSDEMKVSPEVQGSQEVPETAEAAANPGMQEAVVTPPTPPGHDNTRVTLGQNEVFIIEENGDTTKVMLGSRGIRIVEGKDGTEVNVIEMDEDAPSRERKNGSGDESGSASRHRGKKFKPHYAGVELGLNNYVKPDFSMSLPQDELFMDLNTSRSWNVNLNFLEYGIGLGTNKLGLVTGLGFEFTNYVFDNPSSIAKDGNGTIVEYIPVEADNIVKSKFNMTYLTAPLLLEIQIPGGRKSFHLSGGIIGGVKVASNTKIKYDVSGQKSKEKAKGDFNLAPLRYGATVRIGYKALNIFANYYLSPLFGEGGGPELYPFSVGLTLVPF